MTRGARSCDRSVILARRARFVAAALVGLAPAAAAASDDDVEGPPEGELPEQSPRICLSDIDIAGEAGDECGADAERPCPAPGEPNDPEPKRHPPPIPPPVCLSIRPATSDSDFRHDGFYLRAAPAAGLLGVSAGDESSSGWAFGGALAVGITLVDGVVIGVGATLLRAPRLELAPSTGATLWQVGPWVDVYPDPETGWHATLSVAPTVISAGGEASGVGVGGALWLGYDAWVAPAWSLGVGVGGLLGFAGARREQTAAALSARALSLSASVLFH